MSNQKSRKIDISKYATNEASSSLWTHFKRVVKGNPEEYRTTFFRGKSLTDVLNGWQPTLDNGLKQWPSLLEFENDLRKKVGPLSIMQPLSKRMKDIDSYYDSILLESEPIPDYAVDAVLKEFASVRGLRVRGQERTWLNMRKSTNSGLPFYRKRSSVIKDTVPFILNHSEQILKGNRSYKLAAVLGWRGQEGGLDPDDVKQRVIWMFPLALNIAELGTYQPLIESCQRFDLVPAWVSMDSVDRRITKLFDSKPADDLIICTDFEKFDQHFNSSMQNAALRLFDGILTNEETSRRWKSEVFPIKYMIPLMYNYAEIFEGDHGMASGSGGTNCDETLVHRALQHEAALRSHANLNPNSQCLGDDGILSYPGITVEDVIGAYTAHGQTMNEEKQYASKHDCVYLRRWHHVNYRKRGICVGVYSTYRALGRLCEQERYYDPDKWGPKMVALRQLSIIENCANHPLFTEFVDYCMKGDKFRLGLDIPGFMDNLAAEAKEAVDYMPDFLGYSRSLGESDVSRGISQWNVVKYLKSKA